ncbi:uncharacterized protein EDB91DRAFT_650630 [Suillus paluster]|uniref:uncharacterized protein n=1 Tax=Suillus paluster TaxID=48578 RepID=UPI001B87FF10|nr:uncharacterized protein EDB91DRAFT_650630 [Suillus paluster]KAG1733022.1 hypothetical protein EDB91DRAFT_650630 [Suillus paluster]
MLQRVQRGSMESGEPFRCHILILILEAVAVARYPVFIDAIIHSNGADFVGTCGSTMSLLARRRVRSWLDGPTRLVKWGSCGADDH